MSGKLKDEIKQSKPFESLEQEAFLNLARTADYLQNNVIDALKPHKLSPTQYNVLRILRGVHPGSLSCQECASRMITREPDVTRLFDRLETRGLIRRQRSTKDRRVVETSITDQGLTLVNSLDQPLKALQAQQLGHLGPERLRTLIDLLELARSTPKE